MAGLNFLIGRNFLNAIEEAEILANIEDRVYHPFSNPFNKLSDRQFVKLYRLTKPVATELIELLEPHLIPPFRASALSIPRKVSTACTLYNNNNAYYRNYVCCVCCYALHKQKKPNFFPFMGY